MCKYDINMSKLNSIYNYCSLTSVSQFGDFLNIAASPHNNLENQYYNLVWYFEGITVTLKLCASESPPAL